MKKADMNMLMPTIIMGLLAIILLVAGYLKGNGHHITGIKYAVVMSLQILPLLFFALIVAGMIQIYIPKEVLLKWVGTESGFRGIIIGTIAGGLTPGGPYINLPVAAGLLSAGASIGTTVAFLTGWSLWAIARLPIEVGVMGWKFTIIRFLCTFFFPPVAGLLAQMLVSFMKIK